MGFMMPQLSLQLALSIGFRKFIALDTEKIMNTISLRISDNLNKRLDHLSHELDRNKSYLIRQAVEEFLEEREDYLIALARLSKNEKEYTLEEVEKKLWLDH